VEPNKYQWANKFNHTSLKIMPINFLHIFKVLTLHCIFTFLVLLGILLEAAIERNLFSSVSIWLTTWNSLFWEYSLSSASQNSSPLSVWARSIQSIPPFHPTSWRFILVLSSHLCIGLPSGLFLSGFPNKTLYAPLLSPVHVTCPAYSFVFDFITQMVFGKEYRSWSLLCYMT